MSVKIEKLIQELIEDGKFQRGLAIDDIELFAEKILIVAEEAIEEVYRDAIAVHAIDSPGYFSALATVKDAINELREGKATETKPVGGTAKPVRRNP